METLQASPRINRKDLAEKIIGPSPEGEPPSEGAEPRKLALASDLHWLISEGYVIEFNDGSLDLPRVKAKPAAVAASSESSVVEAAVPAANDPSVVEAAVSAANDADEAEIGGS